MMARAAKAKTLPEIADLTKPQARTEWKRLALELEEHDRLYYQQDAPKISDAEYDALRRRYEAIEGGFPALRPIPSLCPRVGAAPAAKFAKVRHAVPMLSLANAFGEDDVR